MTAHHHQTKRFDNDKNAMVDHLVATEDYARECLTTVTFGNPSNADAPIVSLIKLHIGISWDTSQQWVIRIASADTVVVLCSLLLNQRSDTTPNCTCDLASE